MFALTRLFKGASTNDRIQWMLKRAGEVADRLGAPVLARMARQAPESLRA